MPVVVPAVEKTVSIVRLLNQVGRGCTLGEIQAALGLTRSHCYNILRTLVGVGWLDYEPEVRRYRLSAGLLADCTSLLAVPAGGQSVHAVLAALSREIGLPCVLSRALPADGGFVAVDKAEETSELIVSVPLGHVFPSDAPVQRKVVLAWSAAEERRRWLTAWRPTAYTAATIVDPQRLAAEVDTTRERGYAISRGELHGAVMSLAAPIFDKSDRVAFVLQIPGLMRDVEARETELAAALLKAAKEIQMIVSGARSHALSA